MSRCAAGQGLGAADFERALSTRACARTEHFALHYLPQSPKLSTTGETPRTPTVEDCLRFGLVVPKRHARRGVTRSLIKRQGRAGWLRHAGALRAGDWLLRLRSPFSVAQFPSAASNALRRSVRAEVESLFAKAHTPTTQCERC